MLYSYLEVLISYWCFSKNSGRGNYQAEMYLFTLWEGEEASGKSSPTSRREEVASHFLDLFTGTLAGAMKIYQFRLNWLSSVGNSSGWQHVKFLLFIRLMKYLIFLMKWRHLAHLNYLLIKNMILWKILCHNFKSFALPTIIVINKKVNKFFI